MNNVALGVYVEIVNKNLTKKNMEMKYSLLHGLLSEEWTMTGIHSLLKTMKGWGADVIYVILPITQHHGSRTITSHIEFVYQRIILQCFRHFSLMRKKHCLVDNLIRFICSFGEVQFFFGPPCMEMRVASSLARSLSPTWKLFGELFLPGINNA